MPQSVDPETQLGLLRLVQWLSPAFPTGAFAYSHGLEFEVSLGRVTSAADLADWLQDVLGFGAGWQDAVLLSQALERDADLSELASLAQALAPSAERLLETMEQGTAFARATSALTGLDLPACVAGGGWAGGADAVFAEDAGDCALSAWVCCQSGVGGGALCAVGADRGAGCSGGFTSADPEPCCEGGGVYV
jgi:UreF